MGLYADIDRIRRQGLPDAERGFVVQAIHRALDRYLYGTQPPVVVHDDGRHGQEDSQAGTPVEDTDITAVLLAPVSFAAVVADICRELKVEVPPLVEEALRGGDPAPAKGWDAGRHREDI
jgi:hypothetical protein